jgi:TrmH family RNA methyltransferase
VRIRVGGTARALTARRKFSARPLSGERCSPWEGMAAFHAGSVMALKPLQWYKALTTKKGRLAAGAFLVEGHRAIDQIMLQQPGAVREILAVTPLQRDYGASPVRYVTAGQFRAICQTQTPQGVMAVVQLPHALYTTTLPQPVGAKVLLLEAVQDPGNVGTLIRTAAAFDFAGVILTDQCADPLAAKCVQSTAGTILSVWLRRTPHYLALVHALKRQGYVCVAADVHGEAESAQLCAYPQLLLALGNEAAGLSPALLQLTDVRYKIPISAKAESLNVAVCGGVCMYLTSKST